MADIKTKLVLDNAQFTKKAKASKLLIGGLGKGFSMLGGAAKFAATALTGVAVGLTATIALTARSIDRLGKVAKVTGFAAETLQKFQFAAEQSGVTADNAALALRRFSRRLGEAQKGTGELLPALKKLGIETRNNDGTLKSAEQVLFEFADGLANTENASEKLALAFKAFDSEGAELVEVLKNGADGLQDFFNEAERLGFVLTTSSIQAVEQFNDEFNKLQRIIGGITAQFVGSLAPALKEVTTDLQNFLLAFIEEKGGPEALGAYFKDVFIDIVVTVVRALEMFLNILIKIANAFADLIRKFGDDPLFGLGDIASSAADDIVALDKTLKDFEDSLGLLEERGEALAFIEGLDEADPLMKRLIDRFKELERTQRGTLIGTDTPYPGAFVRQAIKDIREQLLEEVGAGIPATDFSAFIEKLLGFKEGATKDTAEKISDDLLQNMTVTGKASQSFLVKLLDKIYGPEGRARVDQFLTDFFDEAEGMLDRLKGVMKLIFGPELVESIKNAFANSDVGDFVKTLAEGLVKGVQMFEDSLADAIVTGKADFSSLADHLRQVLAKAMVQKFITGPIMGLFGLAKGGPAKAGQPYIVGEEGPELFVPGQSGTVIPNHQIAQGNSGGAATSVVYNIQAVDAPSFQSLVARDPEFIYNVSRAGARRTPA